MSRVHMIGYNDEDGIMGLQRCLGRFCEQKGSEKGEEG